MQDKEKQSVAVVASRDEWVVLQKQCKAFIASGFLPDHITKNCSPEVAIAKAVTIVTKGRELGIPPMQSFTSITVISGKPCLSAELMLALCYQRVRGFHATFTTTPEKQHLECSLTMQRGAGEKQSFRFTMEDANRAGLVRPGSPWQKYPASMLRARAISIGARAVCPDAIMGCYTPEELGGEPMETEIVEDVTHAPNPEPVKKNMETVGTIREWDKAAPGWENHLATEKQIARLHAIGKNEGYDHDELKIAAYELFKKERLEDLTKSEIQRFFKEIEEGTLAETVNSANKIGSDADIAQAAAESHEEDSAV